MTNNKANKSKILALILGLTMCLALMLGIVFASPTFAAYAAGETQIDTLGVAFRKVEVGDTLDAAFEFENATTKTLKVPAGANYTATLEFVSKDGQKIPLWDKDEASLPWSRVETQFIEQNVAYYVRVCFKTNDGYKFVKDLPRLRSNMQVLGAELGKGKDIELWDSAGINSIATIVKMSFLITKGMTYIGNTQTVSPEIGKSVTGTIGIAGVDTGFFISGAPGPYTYEAKIAPIGTEIQTSNNFDKSNCYYQITAVNSMDYGTMYITATAADGKTCDIPVRIAAVSGGHEHTWVEEIKKIDFEHHGYTKCTDTACPGVAPAFDKGSQYAVHEFVGGCTEKCTKCGNLDNPNAKHNLADLIEETPATCIAGGMKAHYKCTGCGTYFDEDKKETTEEALKTPVSPYYGHNFGRWVEEKYATCQTPGKKGYKHCSICNKDYDASNTEITDWVIPVNPDGHELGDLIAEVPATCKDPGEKAHRDCKLCGKHCDPITRKEIADLTIPATGDHNYGAWVSNGNGTHTRTCTTGSHSETENCSGGTATCENKAVCSVCGAEYGEKPGHNYGEVKYTWTDNSCKAERVCKNDNTHIESETVTATAEEIKAATCKEKGKMKYTATFENTAFAAQVKEVDIDFTEHTYGDLIPEVPATTTEFGVKEHKDCTVCGKHFDKDGNEITELKIAKIGTHNVVINGESEFYADGESVTVTAEDKEGKVFKGWQDESGKIISTEKSYKFTVSAEKTLTAVYEDAPAAKKGLSGGAIAGIVIGSLAGAGIIGFAIFWFAVRKKSFADLIAAIKGTPKNK